MAGFDWPSKYVVLVWHAPQSPVVGCAASLMAKALPVAVGLELKPLYCVLGLVLMVAGVIG